MIVAGLERCLLPETVAEPLRYCPVAATIRSKPGVRGDAWLHTNTDAKPGQCAFLVAGKPRNPFCNARLQGRMATESCVPMQLDVFLLFL